MTANFHIEKLGPHRGRAPPTVLGSVDIAASEIEAAIVEAKVIVAATLPTENVSGYRLIDHGTVVKIWYLCGNDA